MRRFALILASAAFLVPFTGRASESNASQTEIVFWQSIQNSRNPDDFAAYLARYPNGAFAPLARNNLGALAAYRTATKDVSTGLSATPNTGSNGLLPAGPGQSERARVFVYLGRTIWPGGSKPGLPPMRFDLAVDGGAHQRIKGKHYLEFELPAGRHEFTTYVLAIWGDTRPQTVNFELKPGESLYLALNHYQGISPSLERAGGFFGLAGGLATGLAAGNGEIEGHLPGESLTTDPDGAARVAILRPQ